MTPERAKEILKDSIKDDGLFFRENRTIMWFPNEDTAFLNGHFTRAEIEAIAVFVKG